LDPEKNIITAENLDKGEQIVLPKDPFRQDIYETEDRSLKRGYRIRSIFVRDGWCYYLKEILQTDGFQIYGIDLKDFKEELIYNGIQENDKNFFGAFFDRRQDQTSLPSVDYFFSMRIIYIICKAKDWLELTEIQIQKQYWHWM